MNQEVTGSLANSRRPWVSLAITIHFFAIIVSLAANLSPSELERRILKVLTPYLASVHQMYLGVPLEMTRGGDIDHPCHVEIRRSGNDQWRTIVPPRHFASAWDHRWQTFERTAGILAAEQNEALVHLIFEHCIRREESSNTETPIDSIKLVRRAALSYAADQAYVAGELPESENKDRTLYECRVVRLDGDRIALVPVLESMRTSKSLSKSDEHSEGSSAVAPAKAPTEEQGSSSEAQP